MSERNTEEAVLEQSTRLLKIALDKIENKIKGGEIVPEDVNTITNITKTLSQLKHRNQIEEDDDLDDEERENQIAELAKDWAFRNGFKIVRKT